MPGLDVIITVGPDPLKFMVEMHQRAFPGTPIIFLSTEYQVRLDSSFTGVRARRSPRKP
jgi:hypothetical protein